MALDDLVGEEMTEKYVITAAQAGAPPNRAFLETLESYCRYNDAELVVLPMSGLTILEDELHPIFADYNVLGGAKRLGKHVSISDWNIKPQQILPLTGLSRFTATDRTTIFASPKQHRVVVPNSNNSLPKILMTTGAVTKPRYNEAHRIGQIARRDHRYGAAIVEIEKNGLYHVRNITATVNGEFYDLATLYDGDKQPVMVPPEALVYGDIHAMDLHKGTHKANLAMARAYNPKRLVLHDLFDGMSINHWNVGKLVERHEDYKRSKLSLEKELILTGRVLNDYSTAAGEGEVLVVASNHDERVHRWLQEGRFINEPQNLLLGTQLLAAYLHGHNPLEIGLGMLSEVGGNVTFLTRDDDYKVRGWQLGSHGDKGSNGGRGSQRSREEAYGKSIVAHSHTPSQIRDSIVVGTSSELQQRYTSGSANGWMHTNCFLYDNGTAQLVNIINGRWR